MFNHNKFHTKAINKNAGSHELGLKIGLAWISMGFYIVHYDMDGEPWAGWWISLGFYIIHRPFPIWLRVFCLPFEEVAVPAVDEGDEGSVPRPPVEITSGWDVPWRQSVLFGFSDGLVGIEIHVCIYIYI